jgi:O-antigen ligase
MVSLPFLNPWHYYPITTFYEEWLAFLLGVLASLAFLFAPRSKKSFRLPRTSLWLLVFATLLILHIPFRNVAYPQTVLIGAMYVLWAAMMIIVGDGLREDLGIEAVVRALAWVLLSAALVSSLLAIVQFFRLDTPLSALLVKMATTRATSNLGQPNLLANLLALGVGCAIYLRVAGRLRFVWFAAAIILLLAGMSLTVSRAGSLLIGWIVLTAWWARRGMAVDFARRLSQSTLFVFTVFLVGLVLIFGFDVPGTQPEMTVIGRFYDRLGSFDVGERVYSVRLFLWRQAWQVFLAYPVLGIGWGQLAWGIFSGLEAAPGVDAMVHEPYAHNLLLQLLAETGLVGAVLVTGPLGLWLWRRLRESATPEGWWILALAGAELIHSMIEFPLWYSPFLGVLALLVGLGESRWVTPRLQRLLPLSMIALLVFSAVILVRTWQDYSKLWVWLYASLGVRQEQAESLRPYTEQVLAQLGRSLLVAYMDLPVSSVVGIDRNNLKEKIIFHERVMRFSPTPYVVYRQVLLLALDGREADALNLLERAMRLYPNQIDRLLQAAADLRERDTGAVQAVVAAARARLEAQRAHPMP